MVTHREKTTFLTRVLKLSTMIVLTLTLLSNTHVRPAAAGKLGTANQAPVMTLETETPPAPPEPAASLETETPPATPMPAASEDPAIQSPPVSPAYFPLIYQGYVGDPVEYLPNQSILVCNSDAQPIPDLSVMSSTISIGDPRFIADLDIYMNVEHTWVGDLVIDLVHTNTGQSINLVDRPGYPAKKRGCGGDKIVAILDDEISSPVENKCSGINAISGIFIPNTPLSAYDQQSISGDWTLSISDQDSSDQGRLKSWCVFAKVSPAPAPEAPPPPPPELPAQAQVYGMTGQHQALPLDCESRVAVDWAGFFGYRIDELQFFRRLDSSDNPDKGFVGDVNGVWGQTPPNDYGVHAEPVAELLRAYGVPAYAHRPLRWDDLRAEIAAGRPVFVWVIGASYYGVPEYYTPLDGLHTVVASREHTVTVIGYSPTEVTILDGSTVYTRSIDQFLDSWSTLGNMAITVNP